MIPKFEIELALPKTNVPRPSLVSDPGPAIGPDSVNTVGAPTVSIVPAPTIEKALLANVVAVTFKTVASAIDTPPPPVPSDRPLAIETVPCLIPKFEIELALPKTNVPRPSLVSDPGPAIGPDSVNTVGAPTVSIVPAPTIEKALLADVVAVTFKTVASAIDTPPPPVPSDRPLRAAAGCRWRTRRF